MGAMGREDGRRSKDEKARKGERNARSAANRGEGEERDASEDGRRSKDEKARKGERNARSVAERTKRTLRPRGCGVWLGVSCETSRVGWVGISACRVPRGAGREGKVGACRVTRGAGREGRVARGVLGGYGRSAMWMNVG